MKISCSIHGASMTVLQISKLMIRDKKDGGHSALRVIMVCKYISSNEISSFYCAIELFE